MACLCRLCTALVNRCNDTLVEPSIGGVAKLAACQQATEAGHCSVCCYDRHSQVIVTGQLTQARIIKPQQPACEHTRVIVYAPHAAACVLLLSRELRLQAYAARGRGIQRQGVTFGGNIDWPNTLSRTAAAHVKMYISLLTLKLLQVGSLLRSWSMQGVTVARCHRCI